MKKAANILLAIWLIATSLVYLGGVRFANSGTLLAVLGAVTGILLLLADRGEKLSARAGNVLLGIWVLANGLFGIFHIHFTGSNVILAVLAIAAGIFIIIRP